MVFFSPVMFAGQMTVGVSVASTAMGALTANVAKDFFMGIFMNPGNNFMGVMIVCGVVVATCVGLAFLLKLLFDKCFPKRT